MENRWLPWLHHSFLPLAPPPSNYTFFLPFCLNIKLRILENSKSLFSNLVPMSLSQSTDPLFSSARNLCLESLFRGKTWQSNKKCDTYAGEGIERKKNPEPFCWFCSLAALNSTFAHTKRSS